MTPRMILRKGDRVVFVGDSITEQRMYTNYAEAYLIQRFPALRLAFFNAGWGGDTTGGGARRLERDILALRPTVVAVCYGMNDGGYGFSPLRQVRATFRRNLTDIVTRLKRRGVRVVLMTNGVVDDSVKALGWLRERTNYNGVELRALARETLAIARAHRCPAADLHALMGRTLAAAKRQGVDMGPDGIHPDEGGSLIMTVALLRALGVSPRRERIVLDARRANVWTVRPPTLPHLVDPKARKMLPFLPFTREFNRVEVAFRRPPAFGFLRIGGATTPVFTGRELARGIPLDDLYGIEWLTRAGKINAVAADICHAYRQAWRAMALPDNYDVGAVYDPRPHRLAIRHAEALQRWRRTLLAPPPLSVELCPVPRSTRLHPGSSLVHWRASGRFWVLGESKPEGPLRLATVASVPSPFALTTRLVSAAAQTIVVRAEGPNDAELAVNRSAPVVVKAASPSRDVRLVLRRGANVMHLALTHASGAIHAFRLVVRDLPRAAQATF